MWQLSWRSPAAVAVRTAMIPDIAMPAVRRLVERRTTGRERSESRHYARLIDGARSN
jgi:hypothetical protein